jgi:polar amino acid transport system substrate-binding protein
VQAIDLASARKLHWVVSRVSTLTPIVMNTVRPLDAPLVTLDRSAALDVLRAGKADALLLDLPVALGLAKAEPGSFQVLGQLPGGEGLAVALPHGSSNEQIVDSAIRHFQADGTIDRLATQWLGNEQDVPLIRTES